MSSGGTGDESEGDDSQTIILPSAKVGSISRKQNEIQKYIESGNVDLVELQKLQEGHAKRIKSFEEACDEEMTKDASEEDKKELLKYRKKQEKKYLVFKNKLELWILEEEYKDSEESGSEKSDEFSVKSSVSQKSSKSDESKNEKLLEAILQNQNAARLPDNHPDVFNGEDIMKYRAFIISFERLIEKKCKNNDDKYYYLLHYTDGEAKQLVTSCHDPSNAENAFKQAKELLESRYGNEYALAQQYLDKLSNWEQIKSEDSKELSNFASFLTTCLNMMNKMSALSQLNSWRDLKEIMIKLPYDLRKSFRTLASKQMTANKPVDFKLLVDFVNSHAKERSLPLLGVISDCKSKKESAKKNEKSKTFFVNEDNQAKACECCKKTNHILNKCKFFLQKTIEERSEFVKTRKLCFSCLKSGHRSKDCRSKAKCEICHKWHPSSLHREEKPRPETDNETEKQEVNMATKNNTKIACPAIAVMIRNRLNGKTVKTYAALDNHSTSSYMNEELLNNLDIRGKEITLSIKTMENKATDMNVSVVNNLELLSLDNKNKIEMKKVYAKKDWPFVHEDSPSKQDLKGLCFKENIELNHIPEKIGILVGMDTPELIQPLEIINSTKKGPYLSRHKLGWALNGPVKGSDCKLHCFRITKTNDYNELEIKFNDVFNKDFTDDGTSSKYSLEEQDWLEYVEKNTSKINEKFEISLPFKENVGDLTNNYFQVKKRFNSISQQLKNNEDLCQEYCSFMKLMDENDFMERVLDDNDADTGNYWYLSHHPVRHKQKNKIRPVFDCSLKHKGLSINDVLRKGPDLANTLAGVLLRFRSEKIAVTADISKMFYMVRLPTQDRDFFRFFWYPENKMNQSPAIFRMTAHVFGATSSPAVANFALKKSVQEDCSQEAKYVVENSFYVDDMLASFPDETTAQIVTKEVEETLQRNGFNLTSFSSNSESVLQTIPEDKLSKSALNIEIDNKDTPKERVLGIKWNPGTDVIGYTIKLPDQPATKRGILTTIHSVYDPLFIVSPCLIRAKRLFQICCSLKLDWDDALPPAQQEIWHKWKTQILHLNEYEIPRCYKSTKRPTADVQLHIFCDGSEIAYGAVAYLRQRDEDGNVSCNIITAKSRLTPLNRSSLKTIPRIELNAAKLGVILYLQLKKELESTTTENVTFWTDSTAVLKYLASSTGHFQTYITNRIAFILSTTKIEQWRKVTGKENPADTLSRGTSSVENFLHDDNWKNGPSFLVVEPDQWPVTENMPPISPNDPELKKRTYCFSTKNNSEPINPTNKLLTSASSYYKLTCRVTALLRLKNALRNRDFFKGNIRASELEAAENEIFKQVQLQYFQDTIRELQQCKPVSKKNNVHKLNLRLDDNGLIRVGGRLSNSTLDFNTKHPILLQGDAHPVKLLIKQTHARLGHLGREAVLNELKNKFHVMKANKAIKTVLKECIICRRVQGKPSSQIMADLPPDRVKGDDPPFYHTGTDLFGPFFVSKGRGNKQEKRYGVIFTCLCSRAIHLEITPGLDTDCYLNALRRFICRRGTPSLIRSDNGTNLTATDKELKSLLQEINSSRIRDFCAERKIEWKFQPPNASNFGGVFERMIRTVRKILSSLLCEFKNQVKLNDDLLLTLFAEVENIVNSRPLTPVTSDIEDQPALTPNDLLRLNASNVFPVGLWEPSHGYIKRKWRQAQFLADVFWRRFKREYLTQLQQRHKWNKERRSMKIGDIVFVVDNSLPRNEWNIGKVVKVCSSSDNKVRSCDVSILSNKFLSNKKIILSRPINKLVLLVESQDE